MLTKKTYVVVDDDKINNMVCESVIKKVNPDNEIRSFLRPDEALEYLNDSANATPDILILDINMPEMDGWQFLKEYQPVSKKPFIFILSSSSNQEDFESSKIFSQIQGYIVKPFSKDKFTYIMENLPEHP